MTTRTCSVAGHTWNTTGHDYETNVRITLDGIKTLDRIKPKGIDLVTVRVVFAIEPKR